MMGEHRMVKKMVFYEPSVRVPVIVRPPGGCAPRAVPDLVELDDVSATIRDIAGAGMRGSHARSLLPALAGESVAREVAVSEAYGVAMFRTGRHKLVVYEDTLEAMQFFDLETDPHEDDNLVGTGRDGGMIEAMMAAYARPFLSIRPVRPNRGIIERGRMAKNDFFLPDQAFVR
jgi:choline-sulfatase